MIHEQLDKIHDKLDTIDNKLDDHLGRLSKAEVSIEFIRGHLKVSTVICIAVCGFLARAWANSTIQF